MKNKKKTERKTRTEREQKVSDRVEEKKINKEDAEKRSCQRIC